MRILAVQHVPFEDPGQILQWAKECEATVEIHQAYQNAPFPDFQAYDFFVILGGPMGVYDEREHPWLGEEKRWLLRVIKERKIVLGICLGAQLIAHVLGAKVAKNPEKEIGWFPVQREPASVWAQLFPPEMVVFHWHGDTFSLPQGAERLLSSKGCRNQAFLYDQRVAGLQFHLETGEENIKRLIENCREEMTAGAFVQSEDTVLQETPKHLSRLHQTLYQLLDRLLESSGQKNPSR